jgi:putative nucleotidyltransferase with HDIG domain
MTVLSAFGSTNGCTAVLVVDDPPALGALSLCAISRPGVPVDLAATVAEAAELLDDRDYSLVVCNAMLRGGATADLLTLLAQDRPELPCIVLASPIDPQGLTGPGPTTAPYPAIDPEDPVRLDRDLFDESIRTLVAAIDARDPFNGSHSARVTQLALRLGRAAGLSEEELQVLELGALLHDVGKVRIPKKILAKPGPLDEPEWILIRHHPAYGAEIVRRSELLAQVAGIVRHHHEWVDGSGYPDGLRGEEIPLAARVVGIADAYEAMTSDRSYRRAMSAETARGRVETGLGAQFDRDLGELFLDLEDLP